MLPLLVKCHGLYLNRGDGGLLVALRCIQGMQNTYDNVRPDVPVDFTQWPVQIQLSWSKRSAFRITTCFREYVCWTLFALSEVVVLALRFKSYSTHLKTACA